MEEVFSRKWLVATIATWIVIIILDEVSYLTWKKLNPGSMYSGIVLKHPTQTSDATTTDNYPNGYRPAVVG